MSVLLCTHTEYTNNKVHRLAAAAAAASNLVFSVLWTQPNKNSTYSPYVNVCVRVRVRVLCVCFMKAPLLYAAAVAAAAVNVFDEAVN